MAWELHRALGRCDIDPIGLRPALASVNLQTGWVDNQALDAARREEARQPECIVSNLIAEYDRWCRAGRLGAAIAPDQKLCHQACGISALDPIKARLRPIRERDGQQPAVLAQLEGAMECRLGRYRCFGHLKVLLTSTSWTGGEPHRNEAACVRLIASRGSPRRSRTAKTSHISR